MARDILDRRDQRFRAVVRVIDRKGGQQEQFEYGFSPEEALAKVSVLIPSIVEGQEVEVMNVMVRATYEDEYQASCFGRATTVFSLKRLIRDCAALLAVRTKPEELGGAAQMMHARCSAAYKRIFSGEVSNG